jgi:hypothetical protein
MIFFRSGHSQARCERIVTVKPQGAQAWQKSREKNC